MNGTANPVFRDIEISNVTCERAGVAANVFGKPEQPIERITLENVFIKAEKGVIFGWVDSLKSGIFNFDPGCGIHA